MAKETIFTQRNDSVFVQFEPGKESYYLGECINIDTIPNPTLGGIELTQCWNSSRTGFEVKGIKYTPPGAITFTLSQLLEKTASALERTVCPFWIYVLRSKCGGGLIRNWDSASIVGGDYGCFKLDNPLTNVAHMTDDNENGMDFSLAAPPPRIDIYKMGNGRQTTTLTRALNAVAVYKAQQCAGDCGYQITPCDIAMAVEDGAVANEGTVIQTLNEGTTWTAAAAFPHAVNENLLVCGYVPTPTGGRRYFAGRAQVAGTALELAYSDDNGATWTTTVIGATLNEGFTLDKSLFIMDYEHIWVCTTAGEVYFSGDGGATFASQSATGASGANALNSIHFCDQDFGVAVGAADTVIYTEDGGTNWRALAATGKGVALQAVHVFNHQRWIIGAAIVASGSLVQTYNQGTAYTTMTFVGQAAEEVQSMDFANQFVGVIATNTAGPVGSIHYTKDGGYTWEELTIPTNVGINSIALCSANTGYAVGEVVGATPLILHLGM